MLEKCVDMYYCGTHAPGWLRGGHPSVAGGAVQRKVCFTYYSGCSAAIIQQISLSATTKSFAFTN